MKRIAIVGAGISGLTAAYECCRLASSEVQCSIFESSGRCGGTVFTRKVSLPSAGMFTVELGPDGWVSEKPWATELAAELGLSDEITQSNDAERKIYLLREGSLQPMPQGMRLMAAENLDAIRNSPLLSDAGKAGYLTEPDRADQLRKLAEDDADVSVADFVRRHFGEEATRTFAAPLLAGVFGGDIERLSARSVMPQFLAMEKEHGSLFRALEIRSRRSVGQSRKSVFTALRGGNQSLACALETSLPEGCVELNRPVDAIVRRAGEWSVRHGSETEEFDALMLATPAHVTAQLLSDVDQRLSQLHAMPASSGILVALLFTQTVQLPAGFGFLVEQPQPGTHPAFLACTFSHQKYPHCAPAGCALLRAFLGGEAVARILAMDDAALAKLAAEELRKLLPELPAPAAVLVQRWPRSLPQYEVGHELRVVEIEQRLRDFPGLFLLGNAYRGVGLPDIIKLARTRAGEAIASL